MAYDYRPWNPAQIALLPRNPMDWLPEDHIAPVLLEAVQSFDLGAFHVRGADARGVARIHPTMMVVLVLYCLLARRVSARAMERFIMGDLGARFLCGDGEPPSWSCIAHFRKKFRKQLGDLFAASVHCCSEAGLVDLETVFGDGCKFQSYAGKHANVTYGKVDAVVASIQRRFDEMMAEADILDADETRAEEARRIRDAAAKLPDRKQRFLEAKRLMEERAAEEKRVWDATAPKERPHDKAPTGKPDEKDRSNVVEPESRLMKFKDGSYKQAYNVQAAAEGSNQIVVGVSVSNDCTDPGQLQPTVEHVLTTTQAKPENWVSDGGYLSEGNLAFLDGHKIEPVINPERKPRPEKPPEAQKPAASPVAETASAAVETPEVSKPPEAKKPKAPSAAQVRMRAKFATEEGAALYKKRGQVIEPIFGQIKGCPGCPGMTRFTVRGLDNCRDVMLLHFAAHNIGKYLRSLLPKSAPNRRRNVAILPAIAQSELKWCA